MATTILISSSFLALILLIWFRTEAWVEYCRLFHLNFLSFYKDFYEKRQNDVALTYLGYLRQYHNTFIVRLITCPICLGVWLGIGLILFVGNFIVIPACVLGGLILFGIVDRLLG